MANTVYNLDSAWGGQAQDTKWIYLQEEDGIVYLKQFQPVDVEEVKLEVTTADLAAEFSVYTWQETPGGGVTWYYVDEEGVVQGVDGTLITAPMLALGNYFKTNANATTASSLIQGVLLNYHDTLGY